MPARTRTRALKAAPAPPKPVTGIDDGVAGYGVLGKSTTGNGVIGRSSSNTGSAVLAVNNSSDGNAVVGGSNGSGSGVRGGSNSGFGVLGQSVSGHGVFGYSQSESSSGVYAESDNGSAVQGWSIRGFGVYGTSNIGSGVFGASAEGNGLRGSTGSGIGVIGQSNSGIGLYASSLTNEGVFAQSTFGSGVRGHSDKGIGVIGVSNINDGVYGSSQKAAGLYAESFGWHALYTKAWNAGFRAAYFDGNIEVRGLVLKTGGGFKIDHPVNPENKYLSHSFVESPDMKNMYDGIVTLDKNGEAEIGLPDWFSSLNNNFRYQITPMGSPAPNLYVAEQIPDKSKKSNNSSFKIAGGPSGMKVSWQVTGIRKDPWANAHKIKVEEDKPSKQRGFYLYPELYGKPEEKSISQSLIPQKGKAVIIEKKPPNISKPLKILKRPKLRPTKLKKFVLPTVRK